MACRGAGVSCKKGTLLIFNDIMADGGLDGSSSHQSCPVKDGEKVVVSRFIRQEACHLNKFFSKRKWNGNVFCEVSSTSPHLTLLQLSTVGPLIVAAAGHFCWVLEVYLLGL